MFRLTMMRRSASRLAAAIVLCTTLAYAGESISSLIKAGMPANCAPFAAKVSASEGNFGSLNPYGCAGAFQFCPGTFEKYYSGSVDQFRNDPGAQVVSWTKYEQDSWAGAQRTGVTSLLGQEVCYRGQCATVDQSAILMACQFGCQGSRGKLANYVRDRDCDARNVADGNKLSVCAYLIRGAGHDVSCFTGESSLPCVQEPMNANIAGLTSGRPSMESVDVFVQADQI